MCKLSDDFSGFVDTCGIGKRNHAGALVLGNGRIVLHTFWILIEDFISILFLFYFSCCFGSCSCFCFVFES